MSIYGAMFSGVSGLSAQSVAMGAIADNITNVNTIGYKTVDTNFATLVTAEVTDTTYTPGGVQPRPRQLIDNQGLLQASSSSTDISISGNGFFVVNSLSQPTTTTGQYLFTRAGSFIADQDGFLKNAAGFYLQGWPIDTSGNIPSNRSDLSVLESVNITNLTGTAAATTDISFKANLQSSQVGGTYTLGDMAAGTVTPHFERSVDIFDSLGGTRTLTFGFFKDSTASPNEWEVEIYVQASTDVTDVDGLVSSGTMAFNTDGSLDLTNTTLSTALNITTWAASLGINNSSISLDFGTDGATNGITQFDAASVLVSTDVNGAVFGALAGISINDEGTVTALFDNGTREDVYRLPVATFPNPNGLINKSGNAWIAADASGAFNLQEAGIGGSGKIASSALEASTVDLATEFTKMITTQRAYSAASRIITTADDMLEELIRLKR